MTTRMGLTHRMRAALDFIRAYQLECGRCPSFPEISEGIGLGAILEGRHASHRVRP